MKFAIGFEWTIYGSIDVEAETQEESLIKLEKEIRGRLGPYLNSYQFKVVSVREIA